MFLKVFHKETCSFPDDSTLVEGLKSGSRSAFRALYDRHGAELYTLAHTISGDAAVAEDVTQQTFIRIFEGIHSFDGRSSLKTWITRIAINATKDQMRSAWWRRRLRLEDHPHLRVEEDDTGESDMACIIEDAVSRLSPKLSIVLTLKYIQGMSYEEIASTLSLSAGTVASRMNRAHRQLASMLVHLRKERS